ncbi:MAG: Trm112 family protein [Propionibacteriaceae bacterium]|jgi:uncharacterized protein YbaR (Trm112 family)|nr:Trm112 family protein [Propionibacteriaceae bacterium]
MMSELPAEILDILVCPVCHGPLAWDYESAELICSSPNCALAYPVRQGIPVLLVDEARKTR